MQSETKQKVTGLGITGAADNNSDLSKSNRPLTPTDDFSESQSASNSRTNCFSVSEHPFSHKRTNSPSLVNLPIPQLKPPERHTSRRLLPNYLVPRHRSQSPGEKSYPLAESEHSVSQTSSLSTSPCSSSYSLPTLVDSPGLPLTTESVPPSPSPTTTNKPKLRYKTKSKQKIAMEQKPPILNLSSFLIGACSGAALCMLKPTLQRMLTQGVSTLTTVLSYMIVWVAAAGALYCVIQLLLRKKPQNQVSAVLKPVPLSPSSPRKSTSRPSSNRNSPSRSTPRRGSNRSVLSDLDDQVSNYASRSPSPTKDEYYAYRPYGNTRGPLHHPGMPKPVYRQQPQQKNHSNQDLPPTPPMDIISGDDLVFQLEKSPDQVAYRLK